MQSDIVLLYVAEALGEMNVINFKYVCIIFIMGEKGLCDKRHVLWFKWSTPSRDSLYKGTGNTVLKFVDSRGTEGIFDNWRQSG